MPSVVGASIFLILKTLRSVDFLAVPIATPVELDKQVSKEIFTATMSIFEVQRDGISDLRDSGKYSDLTLECQDIKFPVHKAIVCMYSPVLRATCDDQSQDSGPSVIKVEGFDPSTLKKMLDFIYCGPYRVQNWGGDGAMDSDCDMDSQYVVPVLDGGARQEVREMSQGDNNPMFKLVRPHILAHSIAQYYGVEPLKKHSQDQISGILQGSWSADGFFPVLKFALESSSDEKLRDTMIWGLIRNWKKNRTMSYKWKWKRCEMESTPLLISRNVVNVLLNSHAQSVVGLIPRARPQNVQSVALSVTLYND